MEQSRATQKSEKATATTLSGLAVLGAGVVGLIAVIGALIGLVGGQFVGGGLCLIAAALAFGLLANALLRQ